MFTDIEKLKIKNSVEMVLHVKGNYSGGILEMAFVVDKGLSRRVSAEVLSEIAAALKRHSEVFKNARVNLVFASEGKITSKPVPLPVLIMSAERVIKEGFEDDTENNSGTGLDLAPLCANLKLFQARSKLIIMLLGSRIYISDGKAYDEAMKPFLSKKLIVLAPGKNIPESGIRHWYEKPEMQINNPKEP